MTSKEKLVTANEVTRHLSKRHRAERRFRVYGIVAITLGLSFMGTLFISVCSNGYTAFQQTYVSLNVDIAAEVLDIGEARDQESLSTANYQGLVKAALQARFPNVSKRRDRRMLSDLISPGAAYVLRERIMAQPDLIASSLTLWLPADDDVDMLMKGATRRDVGQSERRLQDMQLSWIDELSAAGELQKHFNWTFFTAGDSREPELSGIWGASVGSFYMLFLTLLLSFPFGVAAAIYLEELAPKNLWTDIIEVNVNNLAAVPSIVFGLLGLAVFINFFGMPRSAPLVGALVLTLMTLPTIIIAGRAALKSVPPSIREAALGMGASKLQVIFHHVLPLAMPGMLTGTIIGMARALGETAPLLMIGMVAFIVDIPGSVTDPSTALPVQIFLWADSPERAFVERTSAAILVLLVFLIGMNGLAVLLRNRFERRW